MIHHQGSQVHVLPTQSSQPPCTQLLNLVLMIESWVWVNLPAQRKPALPGMKGGGVPRILLEYVRGIGLASTYRRLLRVQHILYIKYISEAFSSSDSSNYTYQRRQISSNHKL